METTVLCYNRVNVGDVLGLYRGLYWGYIGILENKMETTT